MRQYPVGHVRAVLVEYMIEKVDHIAPGDLLDRSLAPSGGDVDRKHPLNLGPAPVLRLGVALDELGSHAVEGVGLLSLALNLAVARVVTLLDLAQGITEVVRGIDLLHETAGQILLREALSRDEDGSSQRWMHVPVVVNEQQQKLSKQTYAEPIDARNAAQQLVVVLKLLGVELEPALRGAAVHDVWSAAIDAWDANCLKFSKFITLD